MTSRRAFAAVAPFALAACLISRPSPAEVHRRAGDDLLARSDFAGAAAEYEQSLAADPKQEKVCERLAHAWLKAGDREKAVAALRRKADLQPDAAQKAEVLRQAAGVWLQSTDRDRAEPVLVEVLALAPKDEGTITWLAELAADRGGARSNAANVEPTALEVALRYYDQLIALQPEAQAGYAHKRVVLTRWVAELSLEKHAAELSLPRQRGAEAAGTRARIGALQAKLSELQPQLDQVSQRLAELRKAKSATKL